MSLVLNMTKFWIIQGFEYTKVLKMSMIIICQDSEYTKVLNLSALHRVQNLSEYAWLCLGKYA